MTTINPARSLGVGNSLGSLKPDMNADISILEIKSGAWELPDSEQKPLQMNRLLAPCYAVKSGQIIASRPVGQPQPLQ